MAMISKSELREKVRSESGFVTEGRLHNFAANDLLETKKTASAAGYDIFLSHSYADAIDIKALRDFLVEAGYSVYVDWIEDPELDRTRVTAENARVIRGRMDTCRSLLYAISSESRSSVWMPWELGYMDSSTDSRVAIVPIVDRGEDYTDFSGQEFLGLYPYLDRTSGNFWVQRGRSYVRFKDWFDGDNP